MKEISLFDIGNVRIGNAQDKEHGTGCTVLICPDGVPCGVDIRGGGPASRESALLDPRAAAERFHAVLLSGGSAYGLNAAGGVMAYLEEHDIGFDTVVCKVPLVLASCIYDLGCGANVRPDAAMGYAACVAAETNNAREGNEGAGTGATVGKCCGSAYRMKSGLGMYAVETNGLKVGAIVAVNALGDVINEDGTILAGMRHESGKGFADSRRVLLEEYGKRDTLFSQRYRQAMATNTTIGAVLTNAVFDKAKLGKIAAMASNGLVRSIRPVNTTADGDSIYALSVGSIHGELNTVGALSAYVMEKAIRRAVMMADSAYGIPCQKEYV